MKRVNCIKFTVLSVVNNSKGTCSDSSLALLEKQTAAKKYCYKVHQNLRHIKSLLAIAEIKHKQSLFRGIQNSLCSRSVRTIKLYLRKF